MSDLAIAPVLAAAAGVVSGLLFATAAARLHRAYAAARAFLATTANWTLQVRNEEGFYLYRRNVAKEALRAPGFASVWSEFLDGIHIRYDTHGQPLAEAANEALGRVRHDLAATFAKSHKVTRTASLTLAGIGTATAVLAVGSGVLEAAPLLGAPHVAPARALGALFAAGGTAFVVSALGLLAALVFRAVERWQLQRVEAQVDALGNHLRTFVTFRGEPFYLGERAHALGHEREGVRDFGRNVLERLGSVDDKVTRSADRIVRAVESASGEAARKIAEASHEQGEILRTALAGTREDGRFASREQIEALRSLEGSVKGLEVQIVEALGRASDRALEGVREGELRVVGGLRGAFERHATDMRQTLDNLAVRFGEALHVSGRDLQSSLASLSATLTSDLRGIRPVHFRVATVFTRAQGEVATVISAEPAAPHASGFSYEEKAGSLVLSGAPYDGTNVMALGVDHASKGAAGAKGTVSTHVASEAKSAALDDIPPTLQVMIGCLDLLQSGLRGLGTVRAQYEYLEATCDRLRKALADVQAAALPLPESNETPVWWNAHSLRVATLLTRLDETLDELASRADAYEPVAEAQLAESFVALGRSVEALWKDKQVPALLENLWGASRTPSQLVTAVATLKIQLAPVCRALLHAQRPALALEHALEQLWEAARDPRPHDEAFWKELEDRALPALRLGKVLASSRRRVTFPVGHVSGDLRGVLGLLGTLVHETGSCVGETLGRQAAGSDPSAEVLRHFAKLPMVG